MLFSHRRHKRGVWFRLFVFRCPSNSDYSLLRCHFVFPWQAGAVEAGKATADAAARRKQPSGDCVRQTTQPPPQQQLGSPERHPSPATRADRSGSSSSGGGPASPERNVLDNWRLPKEGRDPSARPGVSAARRQAAAACVRVGSRVSFNTVVAAILIPSAKDLHAAAREKLW